MHSENLIKNPSTETDQETALQRSKAAIWENTTERQTQNGTEHTEQNDELEPVSYTHLTLPTRRTV